MTNASGNVDTERTISETRCKSMSTSGSSLATALIEQFGHKMDNAFVKCGFNVFMKSYMPFTPENEDVDACVNDMLQEDTLSNTGPIMTERNGQYLLTSDFNDSIIDREVFKSLERIAAVVAAHRMSHRICSFPYHFSTESNISNRCRGYFKGGSAMELTTKSIAVPCECKAENIPEKKRENNALMVSANVQIMYEDVRRKFTFGLTIEGADMTLWYFSRSHCAVSEPHNYFTDPKSLITVFMSFMFATSVEMGYDPKVTLYKNVAYTYEVPPAGGGPPRFYRTMKAISNYRINDVIDRMPRIWLVAEVSSTTAETPDHPTFHVLKDVWLASDNKPELEMQIAIFEDIEKFLKEEVPVGDALQDLHQTLAPLLEGKRYQGYFLKIIASGEGDESKPVAEGCKREKDIFLEEATNPHLSVSLYQVLHPYYRDRQVITRTYEPKKQYRVVFEEVCTALGDLETLGESLDIIGQTLIPLRLLFCAGWVHRDISSGNILAYRTVHDTEWKVKLSDLEYAKKFPPPDDIARDDPKTGTAYFMAHEILEGRYLYQKVQERQPSPSKKAERVARSRNVMLNSPTANTPHTVPTSHVIHNFQHDLESLWWLFLWTLTCRVSHPPSNYCGARIFQNTTQLSQARRTAFLDSIEEALTRCLCSEAQPFRGFVEDLRDELVLEAVNRQRRRVMFQQGAYVDIYVMFNDVFQEISNGLKKLKSSAGLILDSGGSVLSVLGTGQPVLPAALAMRVPLSSESASSSKRRRDNQGPSVISSSAGDGDTFTNEKKQQESVDQGRDNGKGKEVGHQNKRAKK